MRRDDAATLTLKTGDTRRPPRLRRYPLIPAGTGLNRLLRDGSAPGEDVAGIRPGPGRGD